MGYILEYLSLLVTGYRDLAQKPSPTEEVSSVIYYSVKLKAEVHSLEEFL